LYTLQQKASGPPQSYYPAGTYYDSSGIFISRFNIFRGNDLDGIFLGLHDNEGNTLERVNMGQLMRQAGIDPDTVGDVTLPLEIVITGMDITIQVSNWETEELEALLH
jgi:hydroxymethylglutaryl-CoA reductase